MCRDFTFLPLSLQESFQLQKKKKKKKKKKEINKQASQRVIWTMATLSNAHFNNKDFNKQIISY